MTQTSTATKQFQKKPLGRRWYLMSGAVTRREFSTATSGTERERGFVGMLRSYANHSSIFSNSNKALNDNKMYFM